MSSFLKLNSAGLRAARKIGEERVSSVASVRIDNRKATGHTFVLINKKSGGGAERVTVRSEKGRGEGRKR